MNNKAEIGIGWILIIVFVLLLIILPITGWISGWFNNGAQVAQKEMYPDALLKKYEWFKDASAQLDNKQATIKVQEGKMTSMKNDYGNKSRDQWARSDIEAYNKWADEVSGVKASYNELAAEYNSQMAKVNWRFTNVGDLPPGATLPLPREYKPYIEE